MRLKFLVILLITLTSCTTFASREYKEAINQSREAQEIEFDQISNNLTKLENANLEIKNSIKILEELADKKKDEKVIEEIDTLTQKQNRIENQIKSLEKERRQEEKALEEEKRKEEKFSNLEPYICKAGIAFYMSKNPNIINVNGSRSYIYLTYIRPQDNKKWSFVCSVEKEKTPFKGDVYIATKAKYLGNNEDKIKYTIYEVNNKDFIHIQVNYSGGASNENTL